MSGAWLILGGNCSVSEQCHMDLYSPNCSITALALETEKAHPLKCVSSANEKRERDSALLTELSPNFISYYVLEHNFMGCFKKRYFV